MIKEKRRSINVILEMKQRRLGMRSADMRRYCPGKHEAYLVRTAVQDSTADAYKRQPTHQINIWKLHRNIIFCCGTSQRQL
jgi:hypothetical protein